MTDEDEYTPTTELVRRDYATCRSLHMYSPSIEKQRAFRKSGGGEGEFDRWLAAHDAELLAGDNFDSLRSRIAALEATISAAIAEATDRDSAADMLSILELAPSVVLDGMIREAKAEAVEAARDAIMPPVNWNLRPDGTEMPGTQHIDEALHDIHVQLSAVAAEYRNEGR